MAISQEQPPFEIDEALREYLIRFRTDVDNEFKGAPKFPERKEQPYKPQKGDAHYFGDPGTHSYDAQITDEGWWGYNGTDWRRLDGDGGVEEAPIDGTTYGRNNATWVAVAGGGGDVTGPAGATDEAVARYDGVTGKLIQDSLVTIDDSGNISTPGTVDGVDVSAHVADTGIHFTEGSIDHLNIQNIGTNSHAQIDSHIADGTIHFTEASIDHTAILNVGTNTHAQIDTHIADGSIHFTEASIDHTAILNIGVNSHAAIDSHIADATIHFTEASIDHTAILNVGVNTHAQIDSHIADATIHFTEASIDHTAILNVGLNTHAQIDSHIADGTIHFTEGSIDHLNIQNIGVNSHAAIDSHIADGTIHFTEASIDHLNILNVGTNTHAQIDTHIADTTIHFTEASIDHTAIQNIGVNSHAAIDSHIADSTIHFTEGSIDHLNIQNVGTNTHAQIDTHIADTSIHYADAPADGNTYGRNNNAWTDLDALYVTIGAPDQTITSVKTFAPFATGILGQDDIVVGDPTDYGLMGIGNATFGRTNFNAGALDLDGAMLSFNEALPATSNIEFAWADGTASIRFALAVPGVGNATYSPRSMLVAGPAALDDSIVTVGYWQGQGIFDNLVCDTAGQGADFGVQNDLEVEGIIYTDTIQESTPAASITLQANPGTVDGQMTWDGNEIKLFPSDITFGEGYIFGWGATGDPTTPFANRWNLNSASGFSFIMSNANFPQWIVGSTDPTSSWFIDGNGNKDIRFNTLDTGFDQDNVVHFGYGGIDLQDQGGDATFIRSAAAVAGTYTITLPDTPGSANQVLVNQDGAATLDWQDKPFSIYPVWAEENAALGAGNFEWAFGNGANTPADGGLTINVPPGYTCEVYAMSLRIGSGTATVQLVLNGVGQGPNGQVAIAAGQGASVTLGTPIALVDGDFINFQTVAAAGTSAPNVVTAWIRLIQNV